MCAIIATNAFIFIFLKTHWVQGLEICQTQQYGGQELSFVNFTSDIKCERRKWNFEDKNNMKIKKKQTNFQIKYN